MGCVSSNLIFYEIILYIRDFNANINDKTKLKGNNKDLRIQLLISIFYRAKIVTDKKI